MKYDLIFYDETCPLCICCVNFIAKRDKKNRFRFAPLTSEKAQKLTHTRENTLIFLERNHKEKIRSKAALRILYLLGYPWKLLGFLYRLPRGSSIHPTGSSLASVLARKFRSAPINF